MSLQGNLENFSLPDVLRFLAAGRKTGRLALGGGWGDGSVWLAEGDVTAVAVDDHADAPAPPASALFQLLRHHDGEFRFDADADADAVAPTGERSGAEPQPVDEIIATAEALLEEWQAIEAVVPSAGCTVALRPELEAEQVTVDQATWSALVAVAAETTVAGVATRLGVDHFDGCRTVKGLVEQGVVVVGDPVAATPDEQPAPPSVEAETPSEPTSGAKGSTSGTRPEPAAAEPAPAAAAGAGGDDRFDSRKNRRRARPAAEAPAEAPLPPGKAKVHSAAANASLRQVKDPALATAAEPAPAEPAEAARPPKGAPAAGAKGDAAGRAGASDDDPASRGLLLKFLSSVQN